MTSARATVYAERSRDIREHWFDSHRADVDRRCSAAGYRDERLMWRKRSGSFIYAVDYHLYGGILVVTGDIGDAIYYGWHGVEVTLQWIAGLDLEYFASKCVASEVGRGYKEWDAGYARKHFEEIVEDDGLASGTAAVYDCAGSCFASQADWWSFLESEGHAIFGDDYTEYGDIGTIVSMRCQAHLLGLRMALSETPEKEKDHDEEKE